MQNEAGRGAPGVLHQFQRGNPEAVRGDPIGDPHLVSGQDLHSDNRRAFLGRLLWSLPGSAAGVPLPIKCGARLGSLDIIVVAALNRTISLVVMGTKD